MKRVLVCAAALALVAGGSQAAVAVASREAMVAISADMSANPGGLVIQVGCVEAKGFVTSGMNITMSISIATSMLTWITMTTTTLVQLLPEASSASA
jgi:hypothetical protein